MRYGLQFSRSAAAYLARLDRPTQERMAEEIRSICEDPFHPSTKALTGAPRLRAARVGGWRIVYAVRQEDALVVIKTIGPRGAVFRGL